MHYSEDTCPECGTDLRDQPATDEEIRHVFDLPPISKPQNKPEKKAINSLIPSFEND